MRWPRVLRATGAFLVAGLLFGTAAHAQNGVITGTVSDASSKQPAPDVVVTATSPNLQGEQVVVTDANGAYRIPQLPPGNYALRFEKESFQPYSRSGIQLRVDRTIRVNVEMLPTGIQQDIVVVGTNPTIDVGSTSTGVNVGADFVRQIAVANPSGRGGSARSFESLADIAPGANADTYGVSVSGTTSPENQFIVDGLSVNDPAFGINATPLSVEFVQDVNVITGGYMPEYGRATGGVFNAVTKSGSNEFHGSVFGTWTPGALEGNAKDITVAGASLTANTTLHNIGDFGADLGGPILQDKLWFYVGVNPSFTRNNVTRTTNQLRLCTTAEIASGEGRCNRPVASGGSRITSTYQDEFGQDVAIPIEGAPEYARYADSRTFQYIGKLTYLVNQDHNLSLSVSGTPTKAGSETAYGFDLQSGANFQGVNGTFGAVNTVDKNNPLDIALKSASSFADKRILLDTTVGWHHQTASTLPVDETTPGSGEGLAATSLAQYRRINTRQSIIDFSGTGDFNAANDAVIAACEAPIPGFVAGTTPGTLPGQTAADWRCPMGATFSVGGPGFIRDDTLDRYQAKSILTYLLNAGGRHVLKGGVDFEYMTFDGNKAYSGGRFLSERGVIPGVADGGYWLELRNYSFASGTGATDLQYPGSLETSQTSATIGGFVQDSWSILDSFTLNAGLRYDAQTLKGSDDRTALAFPNQFSPRVGVIYDFTGQGRSKIFANYARYYEQVPLNLVERGFPGETSTQAGRYKTVDGAAGGAVACDPKTNFAACADPANLVNGFGLINPYAFPLGGGGTTYVDPDIKPQSSDEFSAGAEYEIFANARFGASYIHRSLGNVVEDMSRDEGATYFIGNPGEGIASEFPKAKRNYDAVTVYLDKSFADQWLANISYTYSKLRGNYAGLFRAENGQLDPNINSTFDITSLLANQDGPLPGDRPHQVKVYLAREFPVGNVFSFNLGGTYRGRSGTPLNTLGGHPLYGPNEAYILPRGTAGRMPWRNEVDARVGLNYKLSQASMVTVGLDVFNVFNFQTVTNQDQSYTLQNVRPVPNGSNDDLPGNVLGYTSGTPISPSDVNPNYLQPTAYQAPRTMRVTAKVTF